MTTPRLNPELIATIRTLITESRRQLLQIINTSMVQTYWQIGRLIVEDVQQGKAHADYGKKLLKQLSESLTKEFGKGFDTSNLRNMRLFFLAFPKCDALRHDLSTTGINWRLPSIR